MNLGHVHLILKVSWQIDYIQVCYRTKKTVKSTANSYGALDDCSHFNFMPKFDALSSKIDATRAQHIVKFSCTKLKLNVYCNLQWLLICSYQFPNVLLICVLCSVEIQQFVLLNASGNVFYPNEMQSKFSHPISMLFAYSAGVAFDRIMIFQVIRYMVFHGKFNFSERNPTTWKQNATTSWSHMKSLEN